jgi:hypothetical protein
MFQLIELNNTLNLNMYIEKDPHLARINSNVVRMIS